VAAKRSFVQVLRLGYRFLTDMSVFTVFLKFFQFFGNFSGYFRVFFQAYTFFLGIFVYLGVFCVFRLYQGCSEIKIRGLNVRVLYESCM